MQQDKAFFLNILEQVQAPYLNTNIVQCDYIKQITQAEGVCHIEIELNYVAPKIQAMLKMQVEQLLASYTLPCPATVTVTGALMPSLAYGKIDPLPAVQRVIAVASGKGGVGKSTLAVQMAWALHQAGVKVGILDADLQGPSVGHLLGVSALRKAKRTKEDHLIPVQPYGMDMMSVSMLIGSAPALWRGPMLAGAIVTLMRKTMWHDLDYLIVDLPPGTHDIHLSLIQKLPLDGVVLVTTPERMATLDVEKSIHMFRKMNQPILGVVENFTTHVCASCGAQTQLWGKGGAHDLCQRYDLPFLGAIDYHAQLMEYASKGQLVRMDDQDDRMGTAFYQFEKIALRAIVRLSSLNLAKIGSI